MERLQPDALGKLRAVLPFDHADVVLALQVQPEAFCCRSSGRAASGVGRNRTAKANVTNCRPEASHSASKITPQLTRAGSAQTVLIKTAQVTPETDRVRWALGLCVPKN